MANQSGENYVSVSGNSENALTWQERGVIAASTGLVRTRILNQGWLAVYAPVPDQQSGRGAQFPYANWNVRGGRINRSSRLRGAGLRELGSMSLSACPDFPGQHSVRLNYESVRTIGDAVTTSELNSKTVAIAVLTDLALAKGHKVICAKREWWPPEFEEIMLHNLGYVQSGPMDEGEFVFAIDGEGRLLEQGGEADWELAGQELVKLASHDPRYNPLENGQIVSAVERIAVTENDTTIWHNTAGFPDGVQPTVRDIGMTNLPLSTSLSV